MPSVLTLSRMELNGVGFSVEESERQKKIIIARMEQLESEAYKLAGHPFSLTSTEDICQVRKKSLSHREIWKVCRRERLLLCYYK